MSRAIARYVQCEAAACIHRDTTVARSLSQCHTRWHSTCHPYVKIVISTSLQYRPPSSPMTHTCATHMSRCRLVSCGETMQDARSRVPHFATWTNCHIYQHISSIIRPLQLHKDLKWERMNNALVMPGHLLVLRGSTHTSTDLSHDLDDVTMRLVERTEDVESEEPLVRNVVAI